MRSPIGITSHPAYLAVSAFIGRAVVAVSEFIQLPSAARDVISPFYGSGLLYVRRAAPAYARRATMSESRQVLLELRGEHRGIGNCWGESPIQRQLSRKAP